MQDNNLSDLRQEFEQMAEDCCSLNPEDMKRQASSEDEEDDEEIPHYIEDLQEKLLAPSIAGIYLTRIDLKRIADDLDESLPIKERKRMLRALMRHTKDKATLGEIFEVTNRYINGRVLIYEDLATAFPASKAIFEGYISKAKKMMRSFDTMVEDFEEIEVTEDAMSI